MRMLIKLDYQIAWRGKGIVTYLGLLLLYAAMLFAIRIGMGPQEHLHPPHAARAGQKIFTVISLFATLVTVYATPLFSLASMQADTQKHILATMALSPVRSTTIVVGKLALPFILVLTVVGASVIPVVSLKLSLGGVTSADIFKTHGLLLTLALAILTLSLFCSTLFDHVHTATGVTYLAIICLVGGAIMAGPLISRLSHPGPLLQFVLLVNPLIGMSSALGFDVLRTELIYAISPLGQRRFVYPAWHTVLTCNLLASLLFGLGTVWRVSHLRQRVDRCGV